MDTSLIIRRSYGVRSSAKSGRRPMTNFRYPRELLSSRWCLPLVGRGDFEAIGAGRRVQGVFGLADAVGHVRWNGVCAACPPSAPSDTRAYWWSSGTPTGPLLVIGSILLHRAGWTLEARRRQTHRMSCQTRSRLIGVPLATSRVKRRPWRRSSSMGGRPLAGRIDRTVAVVTSSPALTSATT